MMIVCLVLIGMKLLSLLTIVLSSSLQAGHQVYQNQKYPEEIYDRWKICSEVSLVYRIW